MVGGGGAAQTGSRFLLCCQEHRKSEASPRRCRARGGQVARGQAAIPGPSTAAEPPSSPAPRPRPPPALWQGSYLLWLGLKGPVPMTGRCGPGRFIQRRRDWQAALPETPHITHFTRGEKNLTVWPTFLEQTTRQTTPTAFPKQPQPQPWGSETLVWEELQLQAAVANPRQSRAAPS